MKKFLIVLNILIWSVVCFEVAHAAEPAKKPAVVKKEVKHHKKADGTKMAGTKPDTAPAKKETKKK
jgi:hypothetical protein